MSDSPGLLDKLAVTKHDGVIFVYNVGVALSGAFIVVNFDITDTAPILVVSAMLALFWTLYFRWAMLHRLDDHPRFESDDEDEDEEAGGPPAGMGR